MVMFIAMSLLALMFIFMSVLVFRTVPDRINYKSRGRYALLLEKGAAANKLISMFGLMFVFMFT
jgi:hypothetical protein